VLTICHFAHAQLANSVAATMVRKLLHLDVYAAGAVYRRFEVFQNDESYLRSDLSPVIGYGASSWVAPFGW